MARHSAMVTPNDGATTTRGVSLSGMPARATLCGGGSLTPAAASISHAERYLPAGEHSVRCVRCVRIGAGRRPPGRREFESAEQHMSASPDGAE